MTNAEPRGAERRPPPETVEPLRDEMWLAARFSAGDRAAAEEFVARFRPRIDRLVGRMLGWKADVEDVVQETFVSALVSRAKFRGESRLETWLVRIAVNQCRAFHRRRLLRGELFAAWRERQWGDVSREERRFAAGLDRCDAQPDESAITNERAKAVRETVAALPQKYREVVVLFYLEEMTAQETADILDLKRNTVEVRLSRARKMLADRLGSLADK